MCSTTNYFYFKLSFKFQRFLCIYFLCCRLTMFMFLAQYNYHSIILIINLYFSNIFVDLYFGITRNADYSCPAQNVRFVFWNLNEVWFKQVIFFFQPDRPQPINQITLKNRETIPLNEYVPKWKSIQYIGFAFSTDQDNCDLLRLLVKQTSCFKHFKHNAIMILFVREEKIFIFQIGERFVLF